MIKVVLVDDDEVILSVLQEYIPWQMYQMHVLEAFSDSREALEYLKNHSVDLVFTDLVMPQMTGIELIEQGLLYNQQTAFIALSSYDDFKFVKSAFLKGAKDYVLKEDLDSEAFQEVLKKMQTYCELQQQSLTSNEKLIQDAAACMENRSARDRFSVTLFSCPKDQIEELLKEEGKRRKENLRIIPLEQAVCVLHRSKMQQNNIPWFEPLKSSEVFGSVYISYQRSGEDQEIGALYYRALEELEERIFFERTGFPDMAKEGNDWEKIMRDYQEKIKEYAKKLQIPEAKHTLKQGIEELALCVPGRNIYLEKIIYMLQYFRENFSYLEEQIPCLKLFPYDKIAESASVGEVKEQVDLVLETFVQQLNQVKGSDLIPLVKAYLDCNFADSGLNMKALAEMFQVSEGYLSKRFYKENKIHLKEYMNVIRIEKAKMLLSSTQLSIQGISECVGYNNVEHFSRTFKKIVGIAPNMYRSL